MGIDLATWRARIGLNYCRQSRYACRRLSVQWRAARWGVGEVMNSTPLLLHGCMAVVSLSLILGYTFRRRPIGRCGFGKVCRLKLRGCSVPSTEVRGMADTGNIGMCLLLGVCAVMLALLLMAGDVERNPGPGSDQVDKVLPTVDDTPLGEEDHFDVLREMITVASSWKAIGTGLGIESGRLDMINKNNSGKPKDCLSEMLTCWLNRNYNVERFGEPMWRAVVKVVAHPAAGDNCALALNIAKQHPEPHLPSLLEVTTHRKRRREVEGAKHGVKRKKGDEEQHQCMRATPPQITEQTLFRDQEDVCASKTMSGDMFASSVSPRSSASSRREETRRPGHSPSSRREETRRPGHSPSSRREETRRPGHSPSSRREETRRLGHSPSSRREETRRPGHSPSSWREETRRPGHSPSSRREETRRPGHSPSSRREETRRPGHSPSSRREETRRPGHSPSSRREETRRPGHSPSSQKEENRREETRRPGHSYSTRKEENPKLGHSSSSRREETRRPGHSSSTWRKETQRPGHSPSSRREESFEAGSPLPTYTTSSFPYLKVSGLTPEQQEGLKTRLCVESEDIVHQFWYLNSRIYESLCKRNVAVDKLVTHLLSLSAFDPVYKDSQKPALQTFFQELQSAESIEKVLFIIRDYISFFNYRVIEHIVDGLGTDQDRVELQNYKKKFDEYSRRRIYECPPVYGSMSGADHADLVLKLDSVYENFTVKELKNFEYRLSRIFCVSPQTVLRLCRVEEGCVQLIFQVPSFVQQVIFPLSSEQERALAAEGVIRLTCGDYQFGAKGGENGSEPEDTESVAELRVQVLQAALQTTHDIDADSGSGTSIITYGFADAEEDPVSKELDELDELDEESTLQLSSRHQLAWNITELHLAARGGDLERVKFLMDNEHQNPLQKDEYGDTALHAAAQGGSLDILKYFIDKRNCNPACLGWHGRTPLHDATEHAHLDVVKYLVTEQQVEPLCPDESGWTPLHFSCRGGCLSIVKFLSEEIEKYKPMKDLMPSLTTKKNTPLHLAALNGHIDIVRFFIADLKCSPNIPGFHGHHPLHDAAERGHLHIMKYLIDEQGCDPSCLDEDNSTPLHHAASKGHLDIVKFLTLEKHCNPTSRNSSGTTPIHWAACYGNLEILKFFIADVKCSPNILDQYGRTPLHYAAEEGHLHIVKYLIDEQGCDPSCLTSLDSWNEIPLHCAASKGHLDIVKFLTSEKHCNPTSRNSDGSTPIHRAAQYGHLEIIKFFIAELKCSPNIPGQSGSTPLHYAAEEGHLHVMKYLIDEQGCDPSCLDRNKQTPLHCVAYNGQLDIVKFLTLEKHCNPNQRDIWKNTPLHYAAENGHLQVVQFFIEELKCPPNTRGQHNATPSRLAEIKGHHNVAVYLQLSAFN